MTDSSYGEELPPEVIAQIEKSLDDGVFLRPRQPPVDFRVIDGISWHPGKPNKLAEAIIRRCDHPMTLELDGHHYLIEPASPWTRRGTGEQGGQE